MTIPSLIQCWPYRSENRLGLVLLPNQLNEIKTFLDTPIYTFKLRNPLQEWVAHLVFMQISFITMSFVVIFRHLDLCANPMIDLKVHSQLPKEVKLLINDHMMTPIAAIQKLQAQLDWFAKMTKALTLPDSLPEGKYINMFKRYLKPHLG